MSDGPGRGHPWPRLRRALLPALCVLVLALRVSPEFERVRTRIVVSPLAVSAAGTDIDFQAPARLSAGPAAIVLRLIGGSAPATVEVTLDGRPLGEIGLAAAEQRRIDLTGSVRPGARHLLRVSGTPTGWRLSYVEVANVFGFSRGLLEFNIVPASRPVAGPAWWALMAIAVALFTAPRRPAWPARPRLRHLHRIASAIVLCLFAVVLASGLVSGYKLVLNGSAFALCAAVLYADPLIRLWRWSGIMSLPYRRIATYIPHAAIVWLVLWCVLQFERPGVGFTRLIVFGSQFESTALPALQRTPHDIQYGAGYDGQFYAQLALDPLLRDPAIRDAIDTPGYRGRRILFSWIAWLTGRGDPARVLQAYALINVVAWLLLAILLLRWLPAGQVRATFAWIGCMMSDGLLTSIRSSLPDGASILLIALAVLAVERGRRWLAAAVLGAAGLARETNVLAGAALVDAPPAAASLKSLVLQALIVAGPIVLWIAWLSWRGFPGDAGVRNFDLPLMAWWDKWPVTIEALQAGGWRSFARFSLMSLVSLTTQLVYVACAPRLRDPWWRIGAAYAVLLLVLGDAVWEGHPGAVDRVVLPLTIAFNILLPSSRFFWPLWFLGNLTILHGGEELRVPGLYQ